MTLVGEGEETTALEGHGLQARKWEWEFWPHRCISQHLGLSPGTDERLSLHLWKDQLTSRFDFLDIFEH